MNEKNELQKPVFSFRRLGGMDQFVLHSDSEWQNLSQLDRKLWMALSCPVRGLEFSQATLALLDADGDGRIRVQDAREAVEWVCQRLKHPSRLAEGQENVELENLRDDTDDGCKLITAAKIVLEKQEVSERQEISLEVLEKVVAEASGYPFNGDGILPVESAITSDVPNSPENPVARYIRTGINLVGAKKDASGKPGLDTELSDALTLILRKTREWRQQLKNANLPLGENTSAAWNLYQQLNSKIDDYFCRCNLVSYAPEAGSHINEDQLLQETTAPGKGNKGIISHDMLEALPLARANADGILNLSRNLNPAWTDRLNEFFTLVAPLAEISGNSLKEKDWRKIRSVFEEYSAIMAEKPGLEKASENAQNMNFPYVGIIALAPADDVLARDFMPLNPDAVLSQMTDAQIDEFLEQDLLDAFSDLVKKDREAPSLTAFQDLRKLALYHGNLYTFLNNFLSFADFYAPDKKAIFQSGTLYLDGRACFLCVPVENVDNHAKLAAQSHLCLIYCECNKKQADGVEAKMTIAAALTEGNVASLIEGRHGMFIDNDGSEWDTRIIRVLHNPVSLKEAVWAPYIRMSNMASEQLQKFVASKNKSVMDATGKLVQTSASQLKETVETQGKPGFDFAKGAGIFAALSVAVSVASAAFAYIAKSVASLGWWWPLAIIGIFLCISGPSVLMAWFKLRKRGLGPLLDASYWAVNNDAPINMMMGATLTKPAKLPANARRELNDPYAVPEAVKAKRRRQKTCLTVFFIIAACIAIFALYCHLFGIPAFVHSIWMKIFPA